jgi:hypothetical protein
MAIILDGTNGISTPDVEPTGSTVPTNGLYLPAANSVGIATNSTNAVYINSSQNVGIGTSSPRARLEIVKSSDSASPSRTPSDYSILFTAAQTNTYNNGVGVTEGTYVSAAITPIDTGSGGAQGWAFITGDNSAIAERARIDSSGNLLVGTTSADIIGANSDGVTYRPASKSFSVNATSSAPCNFGRSTSTGTLVNFFYNAAVKGTISTDGSTTAYNTSSDYRLKENIAPMTGALAKVAALNPVTYTWKADGSASQGFIAHELQAVVPDCVTGEKDAVDAEGKPQYQGIDTSFLVATLTAAIKEQQALIEQLTTRIAALEAK